MNEFGCSSFYLSEINSADLTKVRCSVRTWIIVRLFPPFLSLTLFRDTIGIVPRKALRSLNQRSIRSLSSLLFLLLVASHFYIFPFYYSPRSISFEFDHVHIRFSLSLLHDREIISSPVLYDTNNHDDRSGHFSFSLIRDHLRFTTYLHNYAELL